MNRVSAQLPALQAAMIPPAGGGPVSAAAVGDVAALIRAMGRKAKFADMHMALLSGINWERYDDLGRRRRGNADPIRMRVPFSEASLVIEHPRPRLTMCTCVRWSHRCPGEHDRYLWAPGNVAYDWVSIRNRRRCSPFVTAAMRHLRLGLVLHDVGHTDWLRKVRDIRGRCQHADSENPHLSSWGFLASRRTLC